MIRWAGLSCAVLLVGSMELHLGEAWWWQMLAIVAGTCVSEDLTCITVGLYVHDGRMTWAVALVGTFIGLFGGDVGLWLFGRLAGPRLLRWKRVARYVPTRRLEALAGWFEKYGFIAVFASRFMPGTRFPLYATAGLLGSRARKFVIWALISDLIYTPLIITVVAVGGGLIAGPLERFFGCGWWIAPLGALVIFFVLRLAFMLWRPIGRARLAARIEKIWRWEFWPGWIFYAPMTPYHAWLMLRHRGYTVWTCCNPAIEPGGGIVKESKWKILKHLPDDWIVPTALIEPGDLDHRCDLLLYTITERGWNWPVIAKPDVGYRGKGLKRLDHPRDIRPALNRNREAVVVQTYHPGPYEAGIFYYRMPGESRGRIFSITDKEFPELIGDGRNTVEQRIWKHPRYRMQARLFLQRHHAQRRRVLREGERFRLATAGNHAQGTLFKDGAHLITEALTQRLDEIVADFPGFDIGRFDVRYTDPEKLKRGEDFQIVELNGTTSESTNFYDPAGSLWAAYRTLMKQWALLFEIGARRRAMGVKAMGNCNLIALLWTYAREQNLERVGD